MFIVWRLDSTSPCRGSHAPSNEKSFPQWPCRPQVLYTQLAGGSIIFSYLIDGKCVMVLFPMSPSLSSSDSWTSSFQQENDLSLIPIGLDNAFPENPHLVRTSTITCSALSWATIAVNLAVTMMSRRRGQWYYQKRHSHCFPSGPIDTANSPMSLQPLCSANTLIWSTE